MQNRSLMARFAVLLPITSSILWGSAGVFVRELNEAGFNVTTILFARQSIAIVILFAGIVICDRNMIRVRLRDLWIFVASGVFGVLGLNVCYVLAMEKLTLSLAAVLLSMFPVFVMIISAFLFKEKITLRKVGCTALAVLGCAFVTGVFDGNTQWSAGGLTAGIMAAVFYAIYSVLSKLATDRGYGALTITFYSFLMVTICMIPATDFEVMASFVSVDPLGSWTFLIAHSLCVSVLSYALYTAALKYMDTGKAAILGCVEPVAATVFGAIFYAELPGPTALLGLALAVVALTVLCLPDKKTVPDGGDDPEAPSSSSR